VTARRTETLDRLTSVSDEIDRLQAERDELVARARAEHRSWQAIATALGVTRQAAWKAHRDAAATIERVRGRSELSEAEAMTVVKAAQREVRERRRPT
jgi:hypothetical protein